jgi:hypothetical protein
MRELDTQVMAILEDVLFQLGFTKSAIKNAHLINEGNQYILKISPEVLGLAVIRALPSNSEGNVIDVYTNIGVVHKKVSEIGIMMGAPGFSETGPPLIFGDIVNWIPGTGKYRFKQWGNWNSEVTSFKAAFTRYGIPWMKKYPDFASIYNELKRSLKRKFPKLGPWQFTDPIILFLAGKKEQALRIIEIEKTALEEIDRSEKVQSEGTKIYNAFIDRLLNYFDALPHK